MTRLMVWLAALWPAGTWSPPKVRRATSKSASASYSPLDIAESGTAISQTKEHSLVHKKQWSNRLSGSSVLLESLALLYHLIHEDSDSIFVTWIERSQNLSSVTISTVYPYHHPSSASPNCIWKTSFYP
ncbi:hypothetical protein BDR22DRAFT_181945 [Usnea florida]